MVADHRIIGRRRSRRRGVFVFASVAIVLLFAAPGSAQLDQDAGCEYDRRIYREGYEMCQGEQRVRCEEGAWSDIGLCDDPEPGPPPVSGGMDVEERGAPLPD